MTVIQDDRTAEQRDRLTWAVVGTDPFMSGWGGAQGGASFAAWATDPDNLHVVEQEIRNRKDMNRVRIVRLADYRPNCAHLHIYVRDTRGECQECAKTFPTTWNGKIAGHSELGTLCPGSYKSPR